MEKYAYYSLNKIVEGKGILRWNFCGSRKFCREGLATSEIISKKKVFYFRLKNT